MVALVVRWVGVLAVGLLLGGALTAVATLALPPEWAGPWLPAITGGTGLLVAALVVFVFVEPPDRSNGPARMGGS